MINDSLLGLNSDSSQDPSRAFSGYIIDPNKKPSKIIIEQEKEVSDYQENPDFYAQNTGQHTHDGVNSKFVQFRSLAGFIDSLLALPPKVPRYIYDQIKLISYPDDDRLYIYNTLTREWDFVQMQQDLYEIEQMTLPIDNIAGLGWIPGGSAPEAVPFANGAEMFTLGTDFSFFNNIAGSNGYLSFADTKKFKYETRLCITVPSIDTQQAWGFWDNNTDLPATLMDPTAINEAIRWIINNDALYCSCGDGAAATTQLVVGVTIAGSVDNRFKFIFTPGESVQFFVDGILKNTITTTLPSIGQVRAFFSGQSITPGSPAFIAHFPRFSLEV